MKIEPWELNTLGGKIPALRFVPNEHGEAPSQIASIVLRDKPNTVVLRLDFGYGRPDANDIAHAIAALPDCLEALKDLDSYLEAIEERSAAIGEKSAVQAKRAKIQAALKKAGCV